MPQRNGGGADCRRVFLEMRKPLLRRIEPLIGDFRDGGGVPQGFERVERFHRVEFQPRELSGGVVQDNAGGRYCVRKCVLLAINPDDGGEMGAGD